MIGKYFKLKGNTLVVKALTESTIHGFAGEVFIENETYPVGHIVYNFDIGQFEPCEAPQTTQPDPAPNKDTEIRLECLKLAIQSNQGVWQNPETVTTDAQHYYDWITKQ